VLNGTLPSFDIEGDWPLALVRTLTDARLLSAFGTLIFQALVLPSTLQDDKPSTSTSRSWSIRRAHP
jgi:hypothetical protein